MKLTENDIAKLFLLAVGAFAFFKTAFEWRRDLIFYKAANWDFTKDSGRKVKLGNFRGLKGNPVSNKARVVYAYPGMLLVICVFLSLLAYSVSTNTFALR